MAAFGSLIERLRNVDDCYICDDAADRIEELEAGILRIAESCQAEGATHFALALRDLLIEPDDG